MPTLFIANKNYSSWSLRPWVLMRQLDIAFEEKLVPFEADNSRTFRAFSPNGQVPCLHDDGTTVWDSLAIMEYLAQDEARVWPGERPARAFARSVSAEMHSGFSALRTHCTFNAGLRIRLNAIRPDLARDIARIDEMFLQGLERFEGPYLCGSDFTAADAMFAPVAFRVQTYGIELSLHAAAYVQRLLALPAMREWYEAALAESFREEGHEKDALAMGTIIEDHRRPSP